MRRMVVLPQPDGPRMEKNSPARMFRSVSWTAVNSPNRIDTPIRERRPCRACPVLADAVEDLVFQDFTKTRGTRGRHTSTARIGPNVRRW